MKTYIVQEGDTLSALSEKFYGQAFFFRALAIFNNIANPDRIDVGQKLNIPSIDQLNLFFFQRSQIIVERGDTLTSLSQRLNVSIQRLQELNNISDPNFIEAGDILSF